MVEMTNEGTQFVNSWWGQVKALVPQPALDNGGHGVTQVNSTHSMPNPSEEESSALMQTRRAGWHVKS